MKIAGNIAFSEEVIETMREMADRGCDVRSLTSYVQSSLNLDPTSHVVLLAYFCRAFSLPLPDVLPIREWVGSDQDEEINREILPKIEHAKSKWLQPSH